MRIKFPKSLIVGIWVVGIGLVLNGVQPFIGSLAEANSYGQAFEQAVRNSIHNHCRISDASSLTVAAGWIECHKQKYK